MRVFLLVLAASFVIVAAATLKPAVTDNPLGYANAISRDYAKGVTGDSSGWRECSIMSDQGREIGLVCEGTRTIQTHSGQQVDVNYFCELLFEKVDPIWARVDYVLCQ